MSPAATSVTTTLRRERGLTEPATLAAIDQACRRLRLPTIRAVLDEALSAANREQLSYQGFLAELLLAECRPAPIASAGPISARRPGWPRQQSRWLVRSDPAVVDYRIDHTHDWSPGPSR